ncbi:hypothetical protein CPC08DRAFT_706121 [Agrocybe pediades]|nr:hypothetical protein CPC08DRAFT_706121 [Agrocybe pediades]
MELASNPQSQDVPGSDKEQELRVTFFPELFLQRRIWILDILRREGITRVLDVGCGEGQILGVLCQPAPWLTPPPPEILPPSEIPSSPEDSVPPSPLSNEDDIPNLHMTEVHGLDISDNDLQFAIQAITPPEQVEKVASPGYQPFYRGVQRFEELYACVWKGGLEVINENFVDMECIVSTEVIEHLPQDIYPAFAPILLGVYHPKYFLVTTPSYTFNARFTAPDAPSSVRNGYPDPTGRTDRIFRHDDHKFEWTKEEFATWCDETAKDWGYDVQYKTIGRALDPDPWGRDDELAGASSVALFQRRDGMDNATREEKGRAIIQSLSLPSPPHEPLAQYKHVADPASKAPRSLEEIADLVKAKMVEYREVFMRLEELWFEPDIATTCGGWLEFLVRAVEKSSFLNLKRDVDGVQKKKRSLWNVELVGDFVKPSNSWESEVNTSVDYIPMDWIPGEGPHEVDSDPEESTGAEGDVSANTTDDEADDSDSDAATRRWKASTWTTLADQDIHKDAQSSWDVPHSGWGNVKASEIWSDAPQSAKSSFTGWDGDQSGDTTS